MGSILWAYDDKYHDWNKWWDDILGNVNAYFSNLWTYIYYHSISPFSNYERRQAALTQMRNSWYNIQMIVWNTIRIWSWEAEAQAKNILEDFKDDYPGLWGIVDSITGFMGAPIKTIEGWLGLDEGTMSSWWNHPVWFIEDAFGWRRGALYQFYSTGLDDLKFFVDHPLWTIEDIFGLRRGTLSDVGQGIWDGLKTFLNNPLGTLESWIGLTPGQLSFILTEPIRALEAALDLPEGALSFRWLNPISYIEATLGVPEGWFRKLFTEPDHALEVVLGIPEGTIRAFYSDPPGWIWGRLKEWFIDTLENTIEDIAKIMCEQW